MKASKGGIVRTARPWRTASKLISIVTTIIVAARIAPATPSRRWRSVRRAATRTVWAKNSTIQLLNVTTWIFTHVDDSWLARLVLSRLKENATTTMTAMVIAMPT